MNHKFKIIIFLFCLIPTVALAWQPVGGHISTIWTEDVTPEKPWNIYPRPAMERNEWENLNGLWQYAITDKNAARPEKWQGKILVPYPVESSLSGVCCEVGPDNVLWYERTFSIPEHWTGKDILLNFGAVDWQCDVWVNGTKAGSHQGGFTPFSLNITPCLNAENANRITIRVFDPTDAGYQPVGKQSVKAHDCFYTGVTGIWQTVWMEPVSRTNHIKEIKTRPDIDSNRLVVNVDASAHDESLIAEVRIFDSGHEVASGRSLSHLPIEIAMPRDMKLWSTESPNLYDMEVKLLCDGREVDCVKSYAAMRKISAAPDSDGKMRIRLNNREIFNFGLLDQGWWPDGRYTAPTYEAMVYDIDKTKDWGFNMIRKHVKVEPDLWYAYCDRKGILVWQDMPNGDGKIFDAPELQQYNHFNGSEKIRSAESEKCFRKEWKEIIDALYNHPSVVVWVPFNEAWGQFKTEEIAQWTKEYDPSRLVNAASGGNHYPTGDMLDIHHYPEPIMPMFDPDRVNVLGEYGGIGLSIKDHVWSPDRDWGYIKLESKEQVTEKYENYASKLLEFIPKGYSAAVFTQTTDVDDEVNGLMTFDRKVVKVDEERLRNSNKAIISSLGAECFTTQNETKLVKGIQNK